MEEINAEEINVDEIKVGEYVRTKLGYIGKLLREDEDERFDYDIESNFLIGGMPIRKEEIVKHSRNPIDLIKVGDYVNGMLVVSVIELDRENNYIPIRIVFVNRDENCTLPPLKIYNKDIKSIVTKEQFSSVEYRLEV